MLGEELGALSLDGPAAGVMMIPIPRGGVYQGVIGVDEARSVPGIEHVEITAKEGQQLIPLPEGASYLGFIFSRAATPTAVESALRKAHSRLSFQLAESLPTL